MSKDHIVNKMVTTVPSITKKDASKLYDTLIDSIKEVLSTKGSLRIHGFGTLYIVDCSPKKYHNPKSGEKMVHPAQKRLRLKASKKLLSDINS